MAQIARFTVKGLFHKAEHQIDFSSGSPVTIISGPNGVGKTHILRLIFSFLTGDFDRIAAIPFTFAEVVFSNGRRLQATSIGSDGDDPKVIVAGFGPRNGPLGQQEISVFPFSLSDRGAPPRYVQVGEGRWVDLDTSQPLKRGVVPPRHLRYAGAGSTEGDPSDRFEGWLAELLRDSDAVLIDTKRLDTVFQPQTRPDNPPHPTERIAEYIDQVKAQVSDARRLSLLESQQADQEFVKRVLRKTRRNIPEDALRERYQLIAERQAELTRIGLTGGGLDVEFPTRTTDATERRILTVFLNDWARKLQPFTEVYDKVSLLKRIVNEKFLDKELLLDKSGGLYFKSEIDDSRIPVAALSSGEQHILALFTMLLFSAKRNSVVLIDEPEISLHAAWKHAFLRDISEVANLADLQVILATHSSGIINGRWDLMQELGV